MSKASEVSNFLLHLRDTDMETGKYYSLSNLKLQKLLYFCEGIYSAGNMNRRLIDEDFEAWQYGPVIRSEYKRFRIYGQGDIPKSIKRDFSNLNIDQKESINNVWTALKKFEAFDLVKVSHEPNSPWDYAYNNNGSDNIIKHKDIVEYFENA